MAAFSSVGALILYIALAAVPLSAKQVMIHFSTADHMSFTRAQDGWWLRPDDLGSAVYWKSEKGKLLVRNESPEYKEAIDASVFDLTGTEDWSKPRSCSGKLQTGEFRIKSEPQKGGIAITVYTGNSSPQPASIEWQ